MSSLYRNKIILAAVIAAAGLSLAGRALFRSIRPRPGPGAGAHVVPAQVEEHLLAVVFDSRPTEDTLEAMLSAAGDRVSEISRSRRLVPGDRIDDLAKAFSERLRGTLGGDFEGDLAALQQRGDATPPADAQNRRPAWELQAAETRLAPFSTAQIDVAVVSDNGHAADDPAMAGFSTLTWNAVPGRFPMHADLPKAGPDAAEVRVPMEKKGVVDRAPHPVIIGYQFVWSPDRKQWIPWGIRLYSRPGEVHSAVLF